MDAIEKLRRRILADYATSIGLPKSATYASGAPLRPVVPLDTGNRVFIIGAYPSARFGVVDGVRDIPMADNLGPFEPERYYDGERIRVQNSSAELNDNYLQPLGVRREDCWVTDLVKVFLFKEGHRKKYDTLERKVPKGYLREDFEDLGRKSVPWIEEELVLAAPKLVITLGTEVAGVLRDKAGQKARNALLGPSVTPLRVGKVEVAAVHLPHPGIVMREGEKPAANPWPERNRQWVAELARWLKANA